MDWTIIIISMVRTAQPLAAMYDRGMFLLLTPSKFFEGWVGSGVDTLYHVKVPLMTGFDSIYFAYDFSEIDNHQKCRF